MSFVFRVACLAAILASGPVEAQEARRSPLIECIPACLLHQSLSCTNSGPVYQTSYAMNGETSSVLNVQTPHKPSTSGERWEKFEAEFGIDRKDSSQFKITMETAKYQLDRTLFGMQEFAHDVQDAVSFDRELRTLGQSSPSSRHPGPSSVPIPWWDTMEKARFQSDIDLNMGAARAFIGVRLVLPVGD